MPFHNFASKLVLVIASLLVHKALVARCAPPGIVPSETAGAGALPVNPSASGGGGGTPTAIALESDLLDTIKLPFLAKCNEDKISGRLCDLYRSLVRTELATRKTTPVTVDDIQKAAAEQLEPNRFCDNLTPVLRNRKANNPLEKETVCSRWCVLMNDEETEEVGVKPICKVLLWGYKQEIEQDALPHDPVQQAAGAVVPPMLPGNVPVGEVEKKDVESKPVQSVVTQPNIAEPGKAASIPMAPKVAGAEDKKESVPDQAAAVAGAPSDVVAVGKTQATTSKAVTASDTQQKQPDQAEKDSPVEDEDQDNLEDKNQANLDNIKEEDLGNALDNGDNVDDYNTNNSDEDDDQQSVEPKESSVKDGAQLDQAGQANGLGGPDGFPVEEPAAAAAVQIERVDPFFDQDDSNFFAYFMFMMFACIVCYVAYHNKSKLLALVVEGRRSNSGRGGFSKGRKHTAAYRKLDSNLEEAITSNASASSRSTSQIIY